MALNWVEATVYHVYKVKGYMLIEHEDLPMPRTEYRSVPGHSDIDVVAIKDTELIFIECQSWWGPNKDDEEKEFRRLTDRFRRAPEVIFEKYTFLDEGKLKIRKMFVTSGKPKKSTGRGPWDRLERFCSENEIELVEINSIIEELIKELRKRYPKPERVGREKGIARLIIHLIHNDFLPSHEKRNQQPSC